MFKNILLKTTLLCSLFIGTNVFSMDNYNFTNYMMAIDKNDIDTTVSNVLQEIKKVQKNQDAGLILVHNIALINTKNKNDIKNIVAEYNEYLANSPMLLSKASYGCWMDYKIVLIKPTKDEIKKQDKIAYDSLNYGMNKVKESGIYTNYHDKDYIKISLGLDKEETKDLLKYVHILGITKKKN